MFGSEPVGNAEPITDYYVLVLGGGLGQVPGCDLFSRKAMQVIVAEKSRWSGKQTVANRLFSMCDADRQFA